MSQFLYDPSYYRPGQPGWTNQIGDLAFVNTTSQLVSVKLYHPDAPDRVFGTYPISPGANNFLLGPIGMDWGIQVDNSPIRIVGLVSDWNLFSGKYIFQTWPDKLKADNPQTALSDAIGEIYQLLYQSLTTSSPSGGLLTSWTLEKKEILLTVDIPGYPIDFTQFSNPWSPTNPTGSTQSLENFALLVDFIPIISQKHIISSSSVDVTYGEIVTNAQSLIAISSSSEVATYENAYNFLYEDSILVDSLGKTLSEKIESPQYREYLEKRSAYRNAFQEYTTSFSQYSTSNPTLWATLEPKLQQKVTLALIELQSPNTSNVEAALDVLNKTDGSTVSSILSNARNVWEISKRASLSSPFISWHLTSAFPDNWFDTSLKSFIPVSTNLTSFEFARVEIRRPWLNSGLFSLDKWKVAGRNLGSYSKGSILNNDGIFPLLPTGFIIARNLNISANIGGITTVLLSKTDPHIIAWISKIIPYCPRNS